MAKKHRIAVVPGDGIGKEVIPAALTVVEASGAAGDLEFTHFDWSADRYLKDGTTLPGYADGSGFRKLESDFDAIFVGALGDPRVPSNVHAKEILLGMRFKMDLYANVRPVKLLDESLCPLKGVKPADVDFTIIRENTEGLYCDVGGVFKQGTPEEIAVQEDVNTRKGVERVIRYAFEFARKHGKKKVLMSDKSNVMTYAHGLWQRVFREVAAEYSDIQSSHMYVDALCMQMVRDPRQFEVIVTNNMFGDIITDLAAGLQGGLGMAASGNIHPGKTSMFEPVHGSAPPLAGKNVANPIGAILTAAMMLEHLGLSSAASKIDAAILAAVQQKRTTSDIGGSLGTKQCAEWIAQQVQDSPKTLVSNPNNMNTQKGRGFQGKCADALRKLTGEDFQLEVSLQIPGMKPHKFDLVSTSRSIVAECKAFCWTRPDFGIPVAKITTLKEAVQYLRSVEAKKRVLIVQHDLRPRTGETLAAYFVRLNPGLFGDVVVAEMPIDGGELSLLAGDLE